MHKIFLFTLLLGIVNNTYANTQKDSVKVGVFITNLYDFNLAEGSYITEFWTWSLFRNDSISFKESQEITKSKKTQFSNFYHQKKAGYNWEQKKCTAILIQDWDVRSFPFDHQKLTINIEDAMADTTSVVYIADISNSKINKSLEIEGWAIDSFHVQSDNVLYNTTYGDPELRGESVYPSVKTTIYLERTHCWLTFTKLVTGLYVAFLIALLVFKIMPHETESRIGLAVGGLFAAVGNKYIAENIVPTTTQNTLIDNIHNVTFAAILLIVALTIYNSALFHHEKQSKSIRIDNIGFWSILCVYFAINGWMVYSVAF
ncbi:MAG: hypothetical protein IPL63_10065 [Saprospiraceae bacterium]|nr:hypothetical protein [Saprospiraceae bacterium]MBK6563690.1 hypothetical protein [Saprospiraceae bacterium]MBK8373064.1 hypothetical protein [Saprospiraceae bacterium]MBK8547703.1 hypothetical protein [Saprospiraceae bacterium]MBK8852820.1 hypothetical protein [Saprospiraceae bacterium]